MNKEAETERKEETKNSYDRNNVTAERPEVSLYLSLSSCNTPCVYKIKKKKSCTYVMYLFVLCKSIIGTKCIEKEETKMNFKDATEQIDAPITQLTRLFALYYYYVLIISTIYYISLRYSSSNTRGGIFTKAQTRRFSSKSQSAIFRGVRRRRNWNGWK